MRVGIVGASASGLFTAILLKQKNHQIDVTVFDKNIKIGKKINATGNGRCNILNKNISPLIYNNPDFVKKVFGHLSFVDLKEILCSLGIETIEEGNLLYPYSLSAKNVVEILLSQSLQLGVRFELDNKVISYKNTTLVTEKGEFTFDKLVFAVGGKSQKNLGSDGSLFPVFEKHNYKLTPLVPGLCPIKVKESTKPLSGCRHSALVSAYDNDKLIFSESGEILFKDNGLSGIVIFNASRILKNKKNIQIKIDLFPEFPNSELEEKITHLKNTLGDKWFLGLLSANFESLIKGLHIGKVSMKLKELTYTYIENYPFEDSQITIGGISTDNLNYSLESNIEKDIYFVGEVVDIDGPCGGFNLGWCLISAIAVKNAII